MTVRHSEWNHVMSHVVVCGRARVAVDAIPMGNFVHLLVYGEADLCPECIDHLETLILHWREVTRTPRIVDEDG
jgi:hypothetical protein